MALQHRGKNCELLSMSCCSSFYINSIVQLGGQFAQAKVSLAATELQFYTSATIYSGDYLT